VTGPKLSESKGPSYGPGQRQRRRCSSRLGNRAMPGSLGRASEWLLSVKATGDSGLQGKFYKHPASDWWASVWAP